MRWQSKREKKSLSISRGFFSISQTGSTPYGTPHWREGDGGLGVACLPSIGAQNPELVLVLCRILINAQIAAPAFLGDTIGCPKNNTPRQIARNVQKLSGYPGLHLT